MEHVAIMKKSWGLTKKILSGEKKIESRWYKSKHPPWDKIRQGHVIYFKDSGSPVALKADVARVLQFSDLNPARVREILEEYWEDDGITGDIIEEYYDLFKDKKYCMLIFLKNPEAIEPFEIDKTGFGMMSAWICIDSIDSIRKN